jgi:nucleotidyltransferase substrate binding protein (TIGR01987 family)
VTEKQLRRKFENYQKALKRLDESMEVQNPDQFIYDSVVKRFEFTYELAWKLMKAYIEYKGGEDVRFARDVFREAYANGLVKDGEGWLQMMKDRNLSSHTYDEEAARQIYERVKQIYSKYFIELSGSIGGDLGHE